MRPWPMPAGVVAAWLVLGGVGAAGPPSEVVRNSLMAVNRLLDDPGLQEKSTELLAAIHTVVDGSFDFREASQRALGREWRARTPAERDEFVRLFADLLERSYILRMASRASVRGGLAIRYLGESVNGNAATVLTTMTSREGNDLPVEYRMIAHDRRWAVYDVHVDGISIVENYRAQFSRILRQASYGELVAQVKARASEAPAAPAARADVASAPERDEAPRVDGDPPVVALAREAEADRDARGQGQAPLAPAPEPARITPAATRVVVTTASYWIQVGAFRSPDAAGELAARLLEQNLPVAIDAVARTWDHRELILSRVRVGPFADQAELVAKLRFLQKGGYQPFVAREPE